MEEEKQEQIKEELEQLEPEKNKFESLEKFWFIPVILALIAIIVVCALWVMNRGLLAPKEPTITSVPMASPSAEIDESTAALEEQGTSDEISAIEADLNATDLSDIDKELTDIENELTSP